MAPTEQLVLVDDDAGAAVRTLTLNRPSRLNAFTAGSYRRLAELLEEADRDDGVHVLVLRGAGRAFSSGVDLDHMLEDEAPRRALRESFAALVEVLVRLRKPLIGSVHGLAVGFGATVLLHCDVVLLAEGTRLRFPFISLATTPEAASTVLLAEAVGAQHAAELLYTARWIEAKEAVSIGLAARCCEPQRLVDETHELAAAIAAQPAPAVMSAKRLLRAGRADTLLAAVEREFDEARRLGELLGPLRRP